MAALALSVAANFDRVTAELHELGRLLSGAPDPCRETIDRFLDLFEGFVEFSSVRAYDPSAPGAGVLVLSAKLTDPARCLLTALRAGDFDRGVFERAVGHLEASRATVSPDKSESTPADQERAA